MNYIDAFLFQTRHQPMAAAVCAPGTHFNVVSYGRLELFTANIAARAASLGMKRGDVVAIFAKDPILHLALILGLTRIGIVTLSIPSSMAPSEFSIDAVITDTVVVIPNAKQIIHADRQWTTGEGKWPARIPVDGETDEPARIVLTSGTTGNQKAVLLTHLDILKRLQAYSVAFGHEVSTCSRMFLDIGLTTSFGFTWTIYMLSRGGTVFYRGTDPAETLQAFGLYDVECMVASPAGTAELLDYYERTPALRCPFRVMLASGSLLSNSLSERARARMCSNVVATYGASEVSPVATAAAHRIAHMTGAVGFVVPWLSVEAVDDADSPCEPGQDGLIRIRGHTCVRGYYGNPAGSEKVFRNGWFYPGDIGMVTADRVLIISGRENAVLNIGGDKVSPETIERTLLGFPRVTHSVVFARANDLGVDEPWALVVASSNIEIDKLRGHCALSLPAHFVPVRIIQVSDIPRNDMGRVNREQIAKMAASL